MNAYQNKKEKGMIDLIYQSFGQNPKLMTAITLIVSFAFLYVALMIVANVLYIAGDGDN